MYINIFSPFYQIYKENVYIISWQNLASLMYQVTCNCNIEYIYEICTFINICNAILFWLVIVNNTVNFILLMNANYGLFVIFVKSLLFSSVYYSFKRRKKLLLQKEKLRKNMYSWKERAYYIFCSESLSQSKYLIYK